MTLNNNQLHSSRFSHQNNLAVKLSIILLGLSFIISAFFFRKLPPLIPLFYSLPWGEEQLVRSYNLMLIPFSQVVFFIINYLFSITILKKESLLVQIILWSTTIFGLAGLIALIKIVLLVT